MKVETRAGVVEGLAENGYYSFLGVPYAAPITDANRFAAPQPVTPWARVRPATRLGEVCPQLPTYGPVGRSAASRFRAGTDFLTANIRTPSVTGRAPVFVWVHGGGYAVGSGNEAALQSGAFAASGIVEVTLNHRLGALGFLHVDGYPDNRGLLDLIAALEWIRDNIAAFGGDPDQVTFSGRSAGGFAVAAIMAMPAARGLFARAMPQSGGSTAIATPEDAAKLTRRMCAALGTDAAGLARVPMEALQIAQRDLCNESYERHDFARDGAATMLGVPFVPVIDGQSLPLHPEAAALAGLLPPVPMMVGNTTAEYLTHATVQPEMDFDLAARLLHERVLPLGLTGAEIVARYRAALPGHSARGIWRAVGGDLVFQNPASRLAALHARHAPVWKYLFGPDEPDEQGARHGAEVGYVWYRRGMDLAQQPEHQRIIDTAYGARVHDLWVSFIRDARPGTEWGWEPFDPARPRVLHIDSQSIAMEDDRFFGRLRLWPDTPGLAAAAVQTEPRLR